MTPYFPLERIYREHSPLDHFLDLAHLLLPHDPLPALHSLVDPDSFDLIFDLLPLSVVVILFHSSSTEGQQHH